MSSILSSRRSYELPISRDYVRHWSMPEAVREIIQNALDSDSPFEYEFRNNSLFIRSSGSALSTSTLLLGSTSKAHATDKIGSFGEGYKIALLVLTREGYSVKIHNRGRLWVPCFKKSRQFDTEVLCIEDSVDTMMFDGICFEIDGMTPSAEAQVREICLRMQNDIGQVHNTAMGQILLDRPGKLYVGGLLICDTELKYGYNINPGHISLERDRQTVSGFDLKFVAKEMWFLTQQYAQIAKMIEDKVPDLEYAEYGTPELVKEACYLAFRAKYPGAVIAKSQDELDALVKRGMTTEIVVHDRWAPIVSSYKEYKAEVMIPVIPPAEILRQWLSVNRKAIRSSAIESFKLILKQSETWRLK